MSPSHLPAEQHRTKRPFQPSITSYFHTANDLSDIDDSDADDDYIRSGSRLRTIPQPKPHHPTLAPTVPSHIQSSLLSVGMRVRKSVPEGYKTPKPSSLTASHAQTPQPLRKPHSAFRDSPPTDLHIPADSLAASLQHQRELLPFCGLNKIGGYAEQPTPPLFHPTSFPVQAFSQPFSSQDSGYGTDNARAGGKRGWSEEAEVQPQHTQHHTQHTGRETRGTATQASDGTSSIANAFLFSIPASLSPADEEIPVSPLSESPPPSLAPQRLFKQPKSRRRPQHEEDAMDFDGAGEGRVSAGCASDFEEADFLDAEGMEVDGL